MMTRLGAVMAGAMVMVGIARAAVDIVPNPAAPGNLGAATNAFPNIYGTNVHAGSINFGGPGSGYYIERVDTGLHLSGEEYIQFESDVQFQGNMTGDASGLYNLSATNLTGTIATNRFNAWTYQRLLAAGTNASVGGITNGQSGVTLGGTFSGTISGDGGGLTHLNVSASATNVIGDSWHPTLWDGGVPHVYYRYEFGTNSTLGITSTNAVSETFFWNVLSNVIKYAVPVGNTWFEVDAGWMQRITNGGSVYLDFPTTWQHKGVDFVKYAHDGGIKNIFFFLAAAESKPNSFVTSSAGYEYSDMMHVLVDMGADGFKYDGYLSPSATEFLRAAANCGHPCWRQVSWTSLTGAPFPGAMGWFDPRLSQYFNSAYQAGGRPDPNAPFNWTNGYIHFQCELDGLYLVKPGFSVEGSGWVDTYSGSLVSGPDYGSDQHVEPQSSYLGFAAMNCGPVMLNPGVGTNQTVFSILTNAEYLSILQDPLVIPATHTFYVTNGVTIDICVRPLVDGSKAILLVNADAQTNSFVVGSTNCGLWPTFTLGSVFWHSLEYWGTNSVTISVPPTNTLLLHAWPGIKLPVFNSGTNYLSDQPWGRATYVNLRGQGAGENALYRDWRYRTPPTTNDSLVMNGVTYTKGFSFGAGNSGYNDPAVVEFAVKGASRFVTDVGVRGTYAVGLQFTAYLDGSNAWQSVTISNTTVVTNCTLDVSHANKLTLVATPVNSTYGTPQLGVLGNCYVIRQPNTPYLSLITTNTPGAGTNYVLHFDGTNMYWAAP